MFSMLDALFLLLLLLPPLFHVNNNESLALLLLFVILVYRKHALEVYGGIVVVTLEAEISIDARHLHCHVPYWILIIALLD